MKHALLLILLSVLTASVIIWLIDDVQYPKWTVEPAANGKWRSCLISAEWGIFKGCGSPTSYDEALWWLATKGGTEIKNP